tara:strand:- start:237 stop:614 length:378 start_codon:yes stop_codon:yes gene_type:complete
VQNKRKIVQNKRKSGVKLVKFSNLDIKYNEKGLVPIIVQEELSNEVLMMAWMNSISLDQTIKTKNMVYWSRSRNELWRKGETSGNTQKLVELTIDCDQDCLLAKVNQVGPACHTNNKTCFYSLIS